MKTLRLCHLLVALACLMPCAAQAQLQDKEDPLAIAWQKVGSGSMTWGFFDLYNAYLYSETGKYKPQQYPLKLSIVYAREIDAEDLVEATLDQWQHLGYSPQAINKWQGYLDQLWPDVREGDRLTFVATSANQGSFSFNFKLLESIDDPGFAQAFLAIWLSPATSEPKLRQALINQ